MVGTWLLFWKLSHVNPPSCRFLLTNSTDRVIRHFEVPLYQSPSPESEAASEYIEQDIEPLYKFADPVDKVSWNGIGYSADAEWVIAGRWFVHASSREVWRQLMGSRCCGRREAQNLCLGFISGRRPPRDVGGRSGAAC